MWEQLELHLSDFAKLNHQVTNHSSAMPKQEQLGKEYVNNYMVCNEPALFSGFVFVVLFRSITWRVFNNLILGFACFIVLSSKSCQAVSSHCQQQYTKVIRLKIMCHYYLVVFLSTASSFAASEIFVIGMMARIQFWIRWKKQQLLSKIALFSASLHYFLHLCIGKAFSSW